MFIHNASAVVAGTSEDMKKAAALLETISQTIRDMYVAKTGKDAEEIKKMMDAETWMTANEAVEMGFADAIQGSDLQVAAHVRDGKLVTNGVATCIKDFKNMPKFENVDGAVNPEPVAYILPDLTQQRKDFTAIKNKIGGKKTCF